MYPKLRFKGFDDAWEQRKLSELATMHARIGWQNLRTSEFLDSGDYMLITGTDFEDGKVNYSTCHYVEKERYDQDKNIQIKNGSILITKDGTLGKVAYVEGLSMPATLNAGVFNVEVRNENETDRKYLFQFLKAPFLMDYVAQKATGGTIKHLNQNILVDFPIAMPSKAEQIRIGEYFTNIDNLITLHQRQCEALKKQKRFFLQNMFPKEGESEPRIRFNGFTEPWEQRKFKDFTKQTGIRNKENLDLEPYSITNETGFVPQKDAHDEFGYMKNTDRSAYSIVSPNSFAYNPARINVGSIGYYKGDKNVIVSSLYEVFQTDKDIDDSFLWIWFKSSNFFNWINKLQEGSVRQYFYYDKLCECKLPVPSLKEQEKIGTFFSKLDNLITLHQRQYEQLVSLKKYLLSKMFI